ncbi:MAG: hypothetical protein V3T18_09190 [Pseudomonadales bacterium]
MLQIKTLLLLSMLLVIVAGCGDDGSILSGDVAGVECDVAVSEPPIWQMAQQESAHVRVVTTFAPGDAVAARANTINQLQAALEARIRQTNPEFDSQSGSRVSELVVEIAEIETWDEPATCNEWTTASVSNEAIATEIVFLRLNQQFASDIPRFRDLGADADISNERRSGYLTTALLLLESLDTRYLAQTMAVNYERELIKSWLDELSENSEADFAALLGQGLRSKNVSAALRTRKSLEQFDSIKSSVRSAGLQKMDQLIAGFRSQDRQADMADILQRGLSGSYEAAEAAAAALAEYASAEATDASKSITELNLLAQTLRTAELELAFTRLQATDATGPVLRAMRAQIAGLGARYEQTPKLSDWEEQLARMLAEVEEMEQLAKRNACSELAEVESYTEFQFLEYSPSVSWRARRLLVDGTNSEVTVANRVSSSIRILNVTQQITAEDGTAIASTLIGDGSEVASGESRLNRIDLKFDNEHPAAKACMDPLPQRTHECRIYIVTSVEIEGHHACRQTTISHSERVRLQSEHSPDNYTIKLTRDS